MTAPVVWMHRIIELDPTPLAIPPRLSLSRSPAAPSPALECREMPGRVLTYSVWDDTGIVGYVRWRDDGCWRARTLGSANEAADVRTFTTREQAVRWLQVQFERQQGRGC